MFTIARKIKQNSVSIQFMLHQNNILCFRTVKIPWDYRWFKKIRQVTTRLLRRI